MDFRALTPRRVWETRTPDALIDELILGSWFEPGDVIQRIESVQHGQLSTRTRIGYRLRVESAGQTYTVEQQAFCDLAGDPRAHVWRRGSALAAAQCGGAPP